MLLKLPAVAMAGAVMVLGTLAAPQAASAASLDAKFRAAVQRLLLNTKTGAVAEMTDAEKKDLIACVNDVFAGIPPQKKQFVVDAGSDLAELRVRFDKIGSEDQAALKQQVSRSCG